MATSTQRESAVTSSAEYVIRYFVTAASAGGAAIVIVSGLIWLIWSPNPVHVPVSSPTAIYTFAVSTRISESLRNTYLMVCEVSSGVIVSPSCPSTSTSSFIILQA